MSAIVSSFVSYVVIGIALVAVAIGGLFVGKVLRKRSDEKKAKEAE